MNSEYEDRAPPLESAGAQATPATGSESVPVTTEHLSEFAEWLEARLDALDTRLGRFDQISTRNTRQLTDDMAQLRSTVAHLHERTGQLIAGQHTALRDLLQVEIQAALAEERRRAARAARRRVLWTVAVLIFGTGALVLAALWGLGMLPWLEAGTG